MPTAYLNDLLRGRELVLGIPTPILNRVAIEGRETALRFLWLNAPVEDREYVESAVTGQDAFMERHA